MTDQSYRSYIDHWLSMVLLDVLDLDDKIRQLTHPNEKKLNVDESIAEELEPSNDPMLSAVSSSTNQPRANVNQFISYDQDLKSFSANSAKQVSNLTSTGSVMVTNSVEILKQKIQWAIGELKGSTNVQYNIDLCEMIKTASEAIVALRKTEI